jgi:hypothetical protein
MQGQADDLGAGVLKMRLNEKLQRSIILAKVGPHRVFACLIAKKNRANIDPDGPAGFKSWRRPTAA